MQNALFNLGRLMLGGFFVYNGVNHFAHREMLTKYAGAKGVPNADAAVTATGALMMLGGLSILSGYKPNAGLAMVGAFLLGVTPMMHNFWSASDQEKTSEMINFMKNAALLGSVLMLTRTPQPWPALSERSESKGPVSVERTDIPALRAMAS